MQKILVLALFLYIIWLALCVSKVKQILIGQGGTISPVWDYQLRATRKKFPESHIMIPLFTNLVQSRWLDIGSIFFAGLWTLVYEHAKKEPDQWPAILSSHLVNNPCVLFKKMFLPSDSHFLSDGCSQKKQIIKSFSWSDFLSFISSRCFSKL